MLVLLMVSQQLFPFFILLNKYQANTSIIITTNFKIFLFSNKIITFGSLPYTFGELYGILVAYLTTSLKDLDWRQYYYFSLLPIAGSIAWVYVFLPETIPFLIKKNKIEDAYN